MAISVVQITESEFYDELSDSHERVADMGGSAMHSDGDSVLFEAASGHYAKVTTC